MRLSVFIALAATTLLLFAAPATAAFKVPLLLYNGGYNSNYFRYGVPAYTTTARPQPEVKNAFSVPNSYQKYIACVPRTFLFEDCTLCFCMDIPNVALCWDYEGDKCAEMQRLVDQQKNVKNNNPNGVW